MPSLYFPILIFTNKYRKDLNNNNKTLKIMKK